MSVKYAEDETGKPFIVVTEHDEYGPIEHSFSLATIASWRELLGIDDPVEVVEAILHVARNGEPEGENIWAEPYGLLRARENARENEAFRAAEENADPALIAERSEKAAHDAVHVPGRSGECPMDRARRNAREKLGVAAVAKSPGVETRRQPPGMPDRTASKVAELLADKTGDLLACTRSFLHSLTEYDPDPLDQELSND